MTRLVRRLHAEAPFEVTVASCSVMAAYALALPGMPHVLEEHNSHTRWMRDRYLSQTSSLQRLRCWASWRKSALYESRLFAKFDLVTMTSERDLSTTQSLLSHGRPPVVLVPNGVDCTQFRPALAEPRPDTLVFGGALTYNANHEAMHYFLGQVYPEIRRQRPNARLSITGASRGADLEKLSLDDSVTLTGFVDDIRPVVARSWVAVVPLLSGGGTRIKILEAMALGTPVVSTSKGAEGLDVVDGEHLLLADDPAVFAERTLQLLSDLALRQRIAANARRLVETRYGWQQIGDEFVTLVERVAGQHQNRGS
jgi:glycosyltransferase involved in cell wall biosynthesis